jgi:hypothetical protein
MNRGSSVVRDSLVYIRGGVTMSPSKRHLLFSAIPFKLTIYFLLGRNCIVLYWIHWSLLYLASLSCSLKLSMITYLLGT